MTQPIDVFAQWAHPLAQDIAEAKIRIQATALSLHPPRRGDQRPIGILWAAMLDACARGVQVEFILPAPHAAHPATLQNSTAGYSLHEAGGKIHLLRPSRLLHAKTITIDDDICWIGSGNFTAAATAHNHEFYCRFTSPQAVQRLREYWEDQIRQQG